MALKEVNAKEAPEMTQEEVIGLQDLDDAFILAQAQKNAQDDILEALVLRYMQTKQRCRHN